MSYLGEPYFSMNCSMSNAIQSHKNRVHGIKFLRVLAENPNRRIELLYTVQYWDFWLSMIFFQHLVYFNYDFEKNYLHVSEHSPSTNCYATSYHYHPGRFWYIFYRTIIWRFWNQRGSITGVKSTIWADPLFRRQSFRILLFWGVDLFSVSKLYRLCKKTKSLPNLK